VRSMTDDLLGDPSLQDVPEKLGLGFLDECRRAGTLELEGDEPRGYEDRSGSSGQPFYRQYCAKCGSPTETGRGLPGDLEDTQSRYLEAAVAGVIIGCLYLPNGNPAPGPKFDYKLRWFERLSAHVIVSQ
jgi:hypothetical protein